MILGLMILSTISLFGQLQNFTIDSVNNSNYPIYEAKLTAWDVNGNLYHPKQSEINIRQGGYEGQILNITCPPVKRQATEQASIVLMIDKSGSMSTGNRMAIAKEAAKTLVDVIAANSEVSLMSFNSYCDNTVSFTNNKILLKNSIDQLYSEGGTNFEEALNSYSGGVINVSSRPFAKKVIILLTDGESRLNANRTVQLASQYGINIYALNIGQNCPSDLKKVSEQTGGKWFESINNSEQAKQVYMNILRQVQNIEPCTITWQVPSNTPESPLLVTIDQQTRTIDNVPPLPPAKIDYNKGFNCTTLNWFNFDRSTIKKVKDIRSRNVMRGDTVYMYGVVESIDNQIQLKIVTPPNCTAIYVDILESLVHLSTIKEGDVLVIYGVYTPGNRETEGRSFSHLSCKEFHIYYDSISPNIVCNVSRPSLGSSCRSFKYNMLEKRGRRDFDDYSYSERKAYIDKNKLVTFIGYIKGKNYSSYLGGMNTFGFYSSPKLTTGNYTDTRVIGVPNMIFDTYVFDGTKAIYRGRVVGYTINGDSELEDFEIMYQNLIYVD